MIINHALFVSKYVHLVLSKNCFWLASEFPWAPGKLPGDPLWLEWVTSQVSWERVSLARFKDTDTDLACAFAEVCRNHRGSPQLPELH